ncbi:MAG: ribosome silencing factor [Candidatus Shikimatogenerans bostrichidophilus]|nr:MAG: ribosome silencing factor [Candidatus Shikimatogenerans bostrichidophilus]
MKLKIIKKKFFFLRTIIKSIKNKKGKKIKIINTKKKNNLFDYFIICEGISNIHIKTIYNKIVMSINNNFNIKPYNIEGLKNNEWILINYNFVIVNIFLKKIRYYYNIDKLFKNFIKIKKKIFLKKNKFKENV